MFYKSLCNFYILIFQLLKKLYLQNYNFIIFNNIFLSINLNKVKVIITVLILIKKNKKFLNLN